MSGEENALRQRLLESAEQQGLTVDRASAPVDPAELLAFLHTQAGGEKLPDRIEELLEALADSCIPR